MILDENNVELQAEDIDYNLGYLEEEKDYVIAHHDAQEYVEEQGHYEVIAEYPNGGKDVRWVVDVEGHEASEAYDETTEILRYHLYNEGELAYNEIFLLQQQLADTDYIVIKIAEGAADRSEYTEVIADRQTKRARINELQDFIEDFYEKNPDAHRAFI